MRATLMSITSCPDNVIERAGRLCYASEDKITDTSSAAFIEKLIKNGHESVLEHAIASFRIFNVSRSLTHQLVRHRLISVSQQSQRYISEDNFDYVIPPSIKDTDRDEYIRDMLKIQDMYIKWREKGIKKEDARFLLPNACCSSLIVTANFREWRHILKLRLDKKAQWEIRHLMEEIRDILARHSTVFNDTYFDKKKGNDED